MVAMNSAGSAKVLLIPGGGKQNGLEISRHISVVYPPRSGSQHDSSPVQPAAGHVHRKRQRLTHLSPEEKALRRKLKNRVAAQTARDRKKARMSELEEQVLEMESENQKLQIENRLLHEKTHSLLSENRILRQKLGMEVLDTEKEKVLLQARVDEISLAAGSAESAALRLRVPLQQVQAQLSASMTASTWILTAITLQTLSLISSWAFWTTLTQKLCSDSVKKSQDLLLTWESVPTMKLIVPYLAPALVLWGPHQQSWKPLMN
ncbi:X-box-binding protein 1 isoform X1 [Stegostoma tigrinum]|uniref:X-box-binding protein 1 isoform X1 n=1 Tax=Stegostoma tigrinum TaxID=3053191 RepID=UPI00202B4174|nr:X-box-binding protein 1 isoform X1 [Stegostoma tigrinum]